MIATLGIILLQFESKGVYNSTMKTIVTHHYPDADAITSVWLIKTFFIGWEEADIVFVPAGQTLGGAQPDSDDEIVHVDTGMGKFDHHQSDSPTCAARLVFEHLREERGAGGVSAPTDFIDHQNAHHWHEEALDRLTKIVVDIDHFGQVYWPDPASDIYDFSFDGMLGGLKLITLGRNGDREVAEFGMKALDGIYHTLINKVWAESELKTKGVEFTFKRKKGIGIESINDDTMPIAQKIGYALTIRKDPNKGYVRIKAHPGSGIDLAPLYEALKKKDSEATWFLHASHKMLLNGSTKNPTMKSSTLSLSDIIEIVKECKLVKS